MENRYSRDYNYNYEDDRSRHLPRRDRDRRRDSLATIRLLTAGAESIIENSRRYHEHHRDQQYPGESSHFSDGEEKSIRTSYFIGILPLMRNIFLFGLLAIFLSLLSLGEYALFYTLVMPELHSNNVLHFDYTSTGIANHLLAQIPPDATGATETSTETKTTNNTIYDGEEVGYNDCSCSTDTNTMQTLMSLSSLYIASLYPLQNGEILHKCQVLLQSAPVAVVDLFSNHNSWQHYHPDTVPQPKREERILKKSAPHYIDIVLDLPESKTNIEKIGIFSVVVELKSSPSGISKTKYCNETSTTNTTTRTKLLASSTRIARMPHESFWISVVRKVICIVPHVLGAISESRRVIVPSFRFFVESEEFPLRYVTVRLLVSQEKAQRGDFVEITHGMLRIGEELTGIQLVLKEWFFTCVAIGTLIFFSLHLVFVLAIQGCWYKWCQHRQEREKENIILKDDVSESLDLDGFDGAHNNEYSADDRNANPHSHNESSDSNDSERRWNEGQRQNINNADTFDDDQGEWEDLPQQTTEMGSHSTIQNESRDSNRETAGENSDATRSFPSTAQHIILEDDALESLNPDGFDVGHDNVYGPDDYNADANYVNESPDDDSSERRSSGCQRQNISSAEGEREDRSQQTTEMDSRRTIQSEKHDSNTKSAEENPDVTRSFSPTAQPEDDESKLYANEYKLMMDVFHGTWEP